MMKILYIDAANSGISGDMFLSALLSLIDSSDKIISELTGLKNYLSGVKELMISLKKIKRSGLQVNQLEIKIEESKEHRKAQSLLNALNNFLNEKQFSDSAKKYANNVLSSLIQAEKEVHGDLTDKIHLHELSSVDTLIDILGVTRILDLLGVFEKDIIVLCSKLPIGGGTIKSAHGLLPIPAPATLKILEKSNIDIIGGPIDDELVTPTGAALLSNLHPKVSTYNMYLEKVAYSTGQKTFKEFINILRLFYGENDMIFNDVEEYSLEKYIEEISVVETDVDDVTGEILGNFIENIQNSNILDIQVIPSITKKNRPGHIIQILCHPIYKFQVIERIMEELGTLGVRINTIKRVCIDRDFIKKNLFINKVNYEIRFKVSYINTHDGKKIINIKPEYEDLKHISKKSGVPLKKLQNLSQSEIKNLYKKN